MFDDLLAVWRLLKATDKTLEETHAELLRIVPRLLLRSAAVEGRVDEVLAVLRPSAVSIRLGAQEVEVSLGSQEG